MNDESLLKRIELFQDWLWRVDLKSSDPFALQCSKLTIPFQRAFPRYATWLISRIDLYLPEFSYAFIQHRKASHSVGLYAHAELLLAKDGNNGYKMDAVSKLGWLLRNNNENYHGFVWGIPFPWLMGYSVEAPANTPMSTVSPYISDAFYFYGKIPIGISIAEFIANDLKITYQHDEQICLSYSPLDNFQIVNSNAYCAAQLYRAYHVTKFEDYKELADKLVNFILAEQNEDGSWYYWSSHQRVNEGIDSLHQCYIIQGLYRSWLVTKDPRIKSAIDRCRTYIGNTFIDEQFLVRKFPEQKHPYELIDAAEMVVTLDMLGEHELARTILDTTVVRFGLPEKPYFASRINPLTKIPFIRWGESQMFYAMVLNYVLSKQLITIPEVYL